MHRPIVTFTVFAVALLAAGCSGELYVGVHLGKRQNDVSVEGMT